MRIRTSLTVKIDGRPEYGDEVGTITEIHDSAFEGGVSELFFEDFKNSFRAALADASYELTTDLIDELRRVVKEREKE